MKEAALPLLDDYFGLGIPLIDPKYNNLFKLIEKLNSFHPIIKTKFQFHQINKKSFYSHHALYSFNQSYIFASHLQN